MTAHARQRLGGCSEGDGVVELAVEGVVRQVQVAGLGANANATHGGGAAIAARHGGLAGDGVAVA